MKKAKKIKSSLVRKLNWVLVGVLAVLLSIYGWELLSEWNRHVVVKSRDLCVAAQRLSGGKVYRATIDLHVVALLPADSEESANFLMSAGIGLLTDKKQTVKLEEVYPIGCKKLLEEDGEPSLPVVGE